VSVEALTGFALLLEQYAELLEDFQVVFGQVEGDIQG
jgi:hypothetical protein